MFSNIQLNSDTFNLKISFMVIKVRSSVWQLFTNYSTAIGKFTKSVWF